MTTKSQQFSSEIDGSKIAYFTYGETDNTPIVMIHGFRGTHEGLDLISKEMTGYQVIVPDLPGFGNSEPFTTGEHDLENYTRFVGKFIKSLRLKSKPVLLGHSFGSIVAGSFAAQHPEAISKLVLINPIGAPALEGPKAVMSRLAIAYYWLGEKLPAQISHQWLGAKPIVWIMSKMMTKTKDKDVIKYIDNQHFTHFSRFTNSKVVSEAFKTSVSHNVRESAPQIITSTLMIVGDNDDITPLNKQRELFAMFKNAQLEIIENVGHLVHYETPKEAAQMIKSFLKK